MDQAVSDPELAVRLSVAAFCVVAPSVLFVLFDRWLQGLQDDELVERTMARVNEEGPAGDRSPATVLTGGLVDGERRASPDFVTCDGCGAPNPPVATYCDTCLEEL
jgi:hypothetical protein